MDRVLTAELLDELPAADPAAAQSRRDLRRLNALMRHAPIAARALREGAAPTAPSCLVELGAGDGTFLLALARRLAGEWPRVRVKLLDQQKLVQDQTLDQFAQLGWTAEVITEDVFQWLRRNDNACEITVANLFLHHFSEGQLANMFRDIARSARVLVGVEPRRGLFPLGMSRALWAIGCNRVTRHDAVASVRAGFTANELSRLWPENRAWRLQERKAGLFSHLFSASLAS